MKRTSVLFLLGVFCFLTILSCKRADKEEDSHPHAEKVETLIVNNEGEYPRDFDVFGNNSVKDRLQALLGADFKEVKDNFETQTPVVTEDSIYKFTGCKAHNCPGFLTRVYYDANQDNFNVLVTRSGKVKIYAEKEQIRVPKVLEVK